MRCTNHFVKSLGLFFLMCALPLWAFAQNITVKGTVNDNFGPVIGASVVEKGTTNGMITDMDGNFSLSVSKGATLVISYIGYVTQEVVAADTTPIKVLLIEDSQALEEVVVIGYGTARRSDVTGSISSIQGNDLRSVQTGNISSALQGRIAGVEMSQTSSQPGASMQIRIRGTRSLNADNDPLIVLDGIPFAGSISDINPNDIKSMDILKDASSTAIYGSRGANGVIMITTNKGYTEQKAQVTYNGFVNVKTLFAKYPMMHGEEYAEFRKYAGMYTNGMDESDFVDTDWQDLFYRAPAITHSHDVGVTGGGKDNNYSFGAGYFDEQGVIPTQEFKRISMRGSLDQEIGKYVKIGFVTNNSYNMTNGTQISMTDILSMSPIADPYNEDGSLKRTVRMPADEYFVYTKDVIEKDLKETWVGEERAFASYNSFYGQIEIPKVEGLKYRINVGLNYRHSEQGTFTGQGVGSSSETNPSTATSANYTRQNYTVENLITYDRTFNKKHRLSLVGMYSAEETLYTGVYLSGTNIPNESFQYHNIGQALDEISVDPNNQIYEKSGLISWMGRAMYSYDDKYMLSVAFRSDASSRLAKGHQWHSYPAVSAGWNMAKEAFLKDSKVLDELKLRVGYGQTSNQAIDPYKTLGKLSTMPYNFGESYVMGYYVSELPNNELGWEYSSTWNFGVDFSLFNHRLTGTAEAYVQKTKDVLVSVSLPATTGVGSYMANIGATENKGWELSLNGLIVENKNGWSWSLGVNFYGNRNRLTKLASGQTEDTGNSWFVGHPIDVLYDYEKIGLWQADDPYLDILEPGGNVGMIKVKYTGDYNSDGTPTRSIGSADRQIIHLEPRFEGGFNTTLTYKDFDLSIVGAFKSGGKLISSVYSSSGYLNMESGRRGQVKIDYWTEENTKAKYPKPGGVENSNNPKYGSTLGLFSASYLKIRTITLGYNVPKQWLSRFGVNTLRIYATVQNPFVCFSPYKRESGMDPETNAYGDEHQAVRGYNSRLLVIGANSPATRNYMLGINVAF